MIVKLPATLSQSGKTGVIDLDLTGGVTLGSVLDEVEKRIPGATSKILAADGTRTVTSTCTSTATTCVTAPASARLSGRTTKC